MSFLKRDKAQSALSPHLSLSADRLIDSEEEKFFQILYIKMEDIMKGKKEMDAVEAVIYFVGLAVKAWPDSNKDKSFFEEMIRNLKEEADDEMRTGKTIALIEFLKERVETRENFRIQIQEPEGECIIGMLLWRGWRVNGRYIKVDLNGVSATLEFCTGTGNASTFLELPDMQCQLY